MVLEPSDRIVGHGLVHREGYGAAHERAVFRAGIVR